uniref:Uncharacterized protein n=1 Tax=Aplanochytrium stocchinoi TaxID=215587 RepID=A0A7S3LRZ0_9STRA
MKLFVAAVLAAVLAAFFGPGYLRWKDYERTGLAPKGGGLAKDMSAFVLTSLPRLGRLFKTPPSDESLEGFHENLEFNNFGKMAQFKESPHFAENFYFWGNSVQDTSFLFTVRLSFYSVNAAHVVPWFHFMIDGEAWDLPEEFENNTLPHKSGDPREAKAPGLGHIQFTCVSPMREWKLAYKGILRSMKTGERRDVEAEFTLYMNPHNVFRYQIHWDELTAARSMAGKEWNQRFWTNIRNQNQERYCSQAKRGTGYIQFEGAEKRELGPLDGSRDHNFGIRNWRFIHTYIWFPPVKFAEPIILDGVKYSYFTGAMTEYGSSFDNMVVGGLMSEDGKCASWSGATPMRDIATEWYDSTSERYVPVGDKTLAHGIFDWELAVLHSKYILEIHQERGSKHGLWQHYFMLADGMYM